MLVHLLADHKVSLAPWSFTFSIPASDYTCSSRLVGRLHPFLSKVNLFTRLFHFYEKFSSTEKKLLHPLPLFVSTVDLQIDDIIQLFQKRCYIKILFVIC